MWELSLSWGAYDKFPRENLWNSVHSNLKSLRHYDYSQEIHQTGGNKGFLFRSSIVESRFIPYKTDRWVENSPTHVSVTKTCNPCALLPTSIFSTVLEANQNNLYRVFLFPAALLSCCFWIESQTALFLAGMKNKQNSARTDVGEILVAHADGSVFMRCKHSWCVVMINITVDEQINLNENIV